MLFDHRKILAQPGEGAKLEASLDEYLALEGEALSRLRFKRRGPARDGMLAALAQMAMLFAAANMGEDEDFRQCLTDVAEQSARDDAARRALRAFYLRHVERVPGTLGSAVGRLSAARPIILGASIVEAEPSARN